MNRFLLKRAIFMLWPAFLVLQLATKPAHAQPIVNDNEVEIGGGLFHAKGADTGALNLDIGYGYYWTPQWQAGLRQGVNFNFIDGARDVWTATTAPFLNLHFPASDNAVPYVGGFLGLVWNDRDITGTLGPNAGIKVFFNAQTYFGARYRYEWFFDSIKSGAADKSTANHVFNFGIGFVW